MAYLVLFSSLAVFWYWKKSSRPGVQQIAFLIASLATFIWALTTVGVSRFIWLPLPVVAIADIFRLVAWNGLLLATLQAAGGRKKNVGVFRDALMIVTLGLAALGIVCAYQPALFRSLTGVDISMAARFGLTVTGLVLIENLYITARRQSMWVVKYLLIATGGVYAYDLYYFAESLLFGALDYFSTLARPLIMAMMMPFLLLAGMRLQNWRFNVALSQTAALHTTALISSGIYLVAVAAVGYLLRNSTLTWGPLLQILIFFGAGVILLTVLLSGQVRARARDYLSRNFFSLRYDYREEWLRFTTTISGENKEVRESGLLLQQRVLIALAGVVDCSGAALFSRTTGGALVQTANWMWSDIRPYISLPAPLAALSSAETSVIDLSDTDNPPATSSPETRAMILDAMPWLERLGQTAWLYVPLRSGGKLIGVVLLGKPRARRPLNWEDINLFEVLSTESASYLLAESATRKLSESQEFDRINKNFSFVVHDLKNLVTQLSLMVKQAERHGDNPEFQSDAMATVGDSVAKMKSMLVKLKTKSGFQSASETVDLGPVIRQLAASRQLTMGNLEIGPIDETMNVKVDGNAYEAILANVLQNAYEAAGENGEITISAGIRDGYSVCEITDNGPGMSESFIENDLFKPFGSTKSSGFGIGMFQSRELIEGWGGHIVASSDKGNGTTIRVLVPLPGTQPDRQDQNETDAIAARAVAQ